MLALTVVWESTYRVLMHTAQCYRAVAIVVPVVFAGFAAISEQRWARTIVAGVYTAYAMVMLWLFPLFPATPKLGPVYQKITHMVPMEFPLLVIVPALLLDLLRAAPVGLEEMAQGRGLRPDLPGRLPGRAMAFRDFPGFARLGQLVFRHQVFRLFRHARRLRHSPPVCARGLRRLRILAHHGRSRAPRHPEQPPGHRRRRLGPRHPPLMRHFC